MKRYKLPYSLTSPVPWATNRCYISLVLLDLNFYRELLKKKEHRYFHPVRGVLSMTLKNAKYAVPKKNQCPKRQTSMKPVDSQ